MRSVVPVDHTAPLARYCQVGELIIGNNGNTQRFLILDELLGSNEIQHIAEAYRPAIVKYLSKCQAIAISSRSSGFCVSRLRFGGSDAKLFAVIITSPERELVWDDLLRDLPEQGYGIHIIFFED